MVDKVHSVHGMLSEDGEEILGYVHERHPKGECPWCDFIRVENIAREFERRLEVCGERIESLNMWSLGSSLVDTEANRKVIVDWWRLFTRRLDRRDEWTPIFRVLEVGRRGFLHFHCVCTRYISHAEVLRTWRSITGEASNVHVSGSARGRNVSTLIRYLVKYLTKDNSTYRWMGSLYGLGNTSRRVRNISGTGGRYGGLTCYTRTTRGYPERPEPQRKI